MAWLNRLLRVVAATALLFAVGSLSQYPTTSDSQPSATTAGENSIASESMTIATERSRGYNFLLEDPDRRYAGRWCPGELQFYIDTTLLSESELDRDEEIQRWIKVFDAWGVASQDSYRFSYQGERKLNIKSDGEPEIGSIAPRSIGITYVRGTPTSSASDYYTKVVGGRTAGNAGLQVHSSNGTDDTALIGDRGFILIDIDDAKDLKAKTLRTSLYQHESGHALGLGHVTDKTALMNGTLSRERRSITDADAAGLRALANMPCQDG